MTRYRDKETGEVVEWIGDTPSFAMVRALRPTEQLISKEDFRARFEPVEEAPAGQ